uniref:AlNc14C92G5725 protein n=1 Tax=Albugo laibachii Nc14 TaxID=890382 RepID=F0WGJ1_9STRA|nr:AlNc14C92G5725 [Albugo laibachii Nc14]|eukprot:CCA20355.1 AlNc14C92G5725 [Albugo laibachii Nc14]
MHLKCVKATLSNGNSAWETTLGCMKDLSKSMGGTVHWLKVDTKAIKYAMLLLKVEERTADNIQHSFLKLEHVSKSCAVLELRMIRECCTDYHAQLYTPSIGDQIYTNMPAPRGMATDPDKRNSCGIAHSRAELLEQCRKCILTDDTNRARIINDVAFLFKIEASNRRRSSQAALPIPKE